MYFRDNGSDKLQVLHLYNIKLGTKTNFNNPYFLVIEKFRL